jgi:hypothetical protein
MVYRCGRVSILPVYVGRQTSTEDWGEVVVEQRWSELLSVKGAMRRMHVTALLVSSE